MNDYPPFYKTLVFKMIMSLIVLLFAILLFFTTVGREQDRFIRDNHCKPIRRDDLGIADRIVYSCDNGMTYTRLK